MLLLDADAVGVDAWEHHPKVPKVDPLTNPEALSALGTAIGTYFREVEGRDTRCEVHGIDIDERLYVECIFEGPYDTAPRGTKRASDEGSSELLSH